MWILPLSFRDETTYPTCSCLGFKLLSNFNLNIVNSYINSNFGSSFLQTPANLVTRCFWTHKVFIGFYMWLKESNIYPFKDCFEMCIVSRCKMCIVSRCKTCIVSRCKMCWHPTVWIWIEFVWNLSYVKMILLTWLIMHIDITACFFCVFLPNHECMILLIYI